MKSRVLVTNRIPAAVLQHLESDLEIDYHTEQNALSRDQLLARVRDKHGLLCVVTDTIDAGIIKLDCNFALSQISLWVMTISILRQPRNMALL